MGQPTSCRGGDSQGQSQCRLRCSGSLDMTFLSNAFLAQPFSLESEHVLRRSKWWEQLESLATTEQGCNYAIISATWMSWKEIFIGKMQRREDDSHSIETQIAPECVCPEVRLTWLHNLQFSKSKGNHQNLLFLLSLPSIFLPCATFFLCLELAKVFHPATLTAYTGPGFGGGVVVAVFILGFFFA